MMLYNKILGVLFCLAFITTLCIAFNLTHVSGSITVSFGTAPYAMFAEALR